MATRFHFRQVGTLFPAPVSPSFDGGWSETTNMVRRRMDPYTVDPTDSSAGVATASASAGNKVGCVQFVSPGMIAGLAFTTATTFKCQILGSESAANDNIVNRVRVVKVISRDGTTVRATPIAFGNATSVVEWNTANRNLAYLTGETSAVNYTTVAGDRMLLELGYQDSAGVSISGSLRYGYDTTGGGDLLENETDTGSGERPWFESSLTLTFESQFISINTAQAKV